MQRQFPLGMITTACKCGAQPRAYRDDSGRRVTVFLECSPCGESTRMHPDEHQALDAWEDGERVSCVMRRQA